MVLESANIRVAEYRAHITGWHGYTRSRTAMGGSRGLFSMQCSNEAVLRERHCGPCCAESAFLYLEALSRGGFERGEA